MLKNIRFKNHCTPCEPPSVHVIDRPMMPSGEPLSGLCLLFGHSIQDQIDRDLAGTPNPPPNMFQLLARTHDDSDRMFAFAQEFGALGLPHELEPSFVESLYEWANEIEQLDAFLRAVTDLDGSPSEAHIIMGRALRAHFTFDYDHEADTVSCTTYGILCHCWLQAMHALLAGDLDACKICDEVTFKGDCLTCQ